VDPITVTFVNLFQDRDDRWELDPEVLGPVLQRAATGATIVALCRRVNRAFDPAQLDHLHVVYPAARGRICARTRYQAHVRLRSTRPRRLPLSEVGLHQREEGPACRGPSPLTTTPNALVCFIPSTHAGIAVTPINARRGDAPPHPRARRSPMRSDRPPADYLEDALLSSQPVNVPSSPAPVPPCQRMFVAEIACLLCARPVGTARANRWPPTGLVLFQPASSSTASPLATIWRLRCPVCGGNTAVNELTVRTVRLEAPIDWQADRPRLGRPPKWLVRLRQAGGPDAA
jgi:hypothetical protein